MENREQIAFGRTVFQHVCGGELEGTRSGGVICEACGACFSFEAWEAASVAAIARKTARQRALCDFFLPPLYGPRWEMVADVIWAVPKGALQN